MASMCAKMILLVFYLIGTASAEVTLTGEWKENFGWEVTCSWQTMLHDTLQSLRMFRNGVQFLVYRPETKGMSFSERFRSEDFIMSAECKLSSLGGQQGKCVVSLELFRNATEDTYRCETSGERPLFKLEEKEYTAFVPPTDAVVQQIKMESAEDHILRPTVNCTSSGIPAPRLVWTVEGRKIPEDFTHTRWNSTTKLWDSWSTYNPQEYNVLVVCTPELTGAGRVERGRAKDWVVVYNAGAHDTPKFFYILFSMLALLLR